MRRSLIAAAILAWSALPATRAQEPPQPHEDPAKIVTAEACGECHLAELEVWQATPHATGFKTLHRKASAEAIAERLGLRLIKRDSRCLHCHYTPTVQDDELRAVSGVSCESCHGAGRDWIDLHNDYGGPGLDHANESPEHRARRIDESRARGMRRPSDLYQVALSCFGCHTVPDERLVNVGGHSTGSGDFEFVRWSQGEIRHNFLDSFLDGDGTENAERSLERRRVMYVTGRLVELETSLRGVAAASEEGVFLKAMLRRVRLAVAALRAIAEQGGVPEAEQAVGRIRATRVGLGQAGALRRAADELGELTRRFAEREDGVRLAGIDPLLDGSSTAVAALSGEGVGGTGVAGAPASGAGGRHRTIGPGACSGCHGPQNQWWFLDAHFQSADPFFDREPANVDIARRYGLDPEAIARGDVACMRCHGTVVSGREGREVQDGVSCESCHGGAGSFLEPHKEGEASLGRERPGYRAALGLGMVELKDLDVRAATCTGCHYVTERRLLAAGHPSGEGFDPVAAMAEVRHWDEPPAPDTTLRAAFGAAVEARGPVPRVELVELPATELPATVPATSGSSTATPAASGAVASAATTSSPIAPPTGRALGEIKTRLRPVTGFDTVGPAACSGCHDHEPHSRWWNGDAHFRSADPFFEASPRHEQIARLYGISPREMTRGNQVCMDCHGTIVSGREARTVADGVSCESCHGPAAAYLEPHKEGDKALGDERPGYLAALGLGMRELRRPEVLAANCASCHLVTEPRLISAGHPTGAGFDGLAGLERVRHWQHPDDTAALRAAFRELLERRAPPPERARVAGQPTAAPEPLVPRPHASPWPVEGGQLELPPRPAIAPSTPIEDVLLILKARIELLYQKVRQP